MNLHGSAEEALQKRIVQFLSDTGALRQTLIEAGIHARGDLPQPEPVKRRPPGRSRMQRIAEGTKWFGTRREQR